MSSRPEEEAAARKAPLTKYLIVAACILPFLSLGTCAAANSTTSSHSEVSGMVFMLGLILFAFSVIAGLGVMMLALFRSPRHVHLAAFVVNALGVWANVSYALGQFTYTRGRQIRGAHGRVLPARGPDELPEEELAMAARAWRNNGDTEAASVSAFSMLSLDLAELGAPFDLVRAAHEDALDEIRHAELCYDLTRSLGDPSGALAPMSGLRSVRARECSLASVAVESWIEGAYLETVSAEIAGALVAKTTDEKILSVLRVIMTDEARHAEHAWAIVEWALQRDRSKVGAALEQAMKRVPAPEPGDGELGSDGSLEKHGIAGRDMQRAIAERTLLAAKARLSRTLHDASDAPRRASA